MLEMGIVVGIGLIVMLAKLSWRGKMMMLSNPLAADIVVFDRDWNVRTCLVGGRFVKNEL